MSCWYSTPARVTTSAQTSGERSCSASSASHSRAMLPDHARLMMPIGTCCVSYSDLPMNQAVSDGFSTQSFRRSVRTYG
jgi:hypothetical protein